MEKKRAPSEQKAQTLRAMVPGHLETQSGEEVLSPSVRLSTERVVQEAVAHEPAEALGRGRYEARGEKLGYRHGYENGTRKTAEGGLQVKLPQIWGREEPSRSALWRQGATTREVLKRLIGEM
jgi:hypothetical protein